MPHDAFEIDYVKVEKVLFQEKESDVKVLHILAS